MMHSSTDAKSHPVVILAAVDVEDAVEELPLRTVVVICDVDPEYAASVAQRVTAHRTAVFVGDPQDPADRAAAEVFGKEMFQRQS